MSTEDRIARHRERQRQEAEYRRALAERVKFFGDAWGRAVADESAALARHAENEGITVEELRRRMAAEAWDAQRRDKY